MKRFIYIFIILSLVFVPVKSLALEDEKDEKLENSNQEVVILSSCVDGDTAKFKKENNEIIKVRFLAIDTPEVSHPTKKEEAFGKEASKYTCDMLTNSKKIVLEYDSNSDEEDKYGRKLAWVFVDGELLQNSIISNGYAKVAYLYGDYKYTSDLKELEKTAKLKKVGIWSEQEEKEEVKEVKKTAKKKKKKNFIEQLIDDILDLIIDFINQLIEVILKSIESVL